MDLSFIPNGILAVVSVLLAPFGFVLRALHNVVPDPLHDAIVSFASSGSTFAQGLSWLNWFLPLDFVVSTLAIFIPALIAFFGYRIVVKFLVRAVDI